MSPSRGHDGRRRGKRPRDPDGRRDAKRPQPDGRRDAKQREPDERRAGQRETEQEAQDWARETGYRPSVNQQRHEPMPASHQADHGQEAVQRNEEHMRTPARAAPSRRARRRG